VAVSSEPDLLGALAEAGAPVDSVWNWSNSATPAPAIPVLLEWLGRIGPEQVRLREGMVRALTTRAARPEAAAVITAEMRRQAPHATDWTTLWVYGNALSVVADDAAFGEVAGLAVDSSLGRAREMLPGALGKMATPRATDVLVGLLGDPDISGQVVVALGRRRGVPAEAFDPFLDDSRPWVRKAALRGRTRP
jgi:hypothetical protein